MSYWKSGPKRDEHNFFSSAFSMIDEFSTTPAKCSPVFRELASKASNGYIENWNEIPLPQITQTDFGGYRQAVETIFRRFNAIYKNNSESTQYRIKKLLEQSVAIIKKRICDVERCGLQGEPKAAANHLNVIELWSRCIKQSMETIDHFEKSKNSVSQGNGVMSDYWLFKPVTTIGRKSAPSLEDQLLPWFPLIFFIGWVFICYFDKIEEYILNAYGEDL